MTTKLDMDQERIKESKIRENVKKIMVTMKITISNTHIVKQHKTNRKYLSSRSQMNDGSTTTTTTKAVTTTTTITTPTTTTKITTTIMMTTTAITITMMTTTTMTSDRNLSCFKR